MSPRVHDKAKMREYNRLYRERHPDRRKQSCAKWYQKNRDRLLPIQRAKNRAHPEYQRRYLELHPERRRSTCQDYYLRNKLSYATRARRWKDLNPGKVLEISKRYRAAHCDVVNARARAYYWQNREACLHTNRAWKITHQETCRAWQRKYQRERRARDGTWRERERVRALMKADRKHPWRPLLREVNRTRKLIDDCQNELASIVSRRMYAGCD